MSGTIFTSTIAHLLKKTLNSISRDTKDGLESSLLFPKWCKVGSMEDRFEDDLEMAGPGLVSEKPEGAEIEADTIREGYITRYIARTFAKKILITEEAMEDNKYDEAVPVARMIKRSMYLTTDYDATLMWARGWNSSYVGGDGQPLFSASHPLANGGTFSNLMTTPMSPSVSALIVAVTQIMGFPGHDGLVQNSIKPVKLMYPNAQWGVWASVLKSEKTPDPGNFAEINVVRSEYDIQPIRNPFWTDTTTRWGLITDVDDGLQFKWRRKPRGRTWVDEDNMVMKNAQSARWARGWTNPRCALGVNA
jgi:hypothetical protein